MGSQLHNAETLGLNTETLVGAKLIKTRDLMTRSRSPPVSQQQWLTGTCFADAVPVMRCNASYSPSTVLVVALCSLAAWAV